MRRAVTSPKRVFLFSIAILAALALGGPSGALAEAGLDASSLAAERGGELVAQFFSQVPRVEGMNVNQAISLLRQAGYQSRVAGQMPTTNQSQNGKVARQIPPAGTPMPGGRQPVLLQVWVYRAGGPPSGPTQVQVPDVKGKTQAEAERLLKSKGLNPQVGGVVPTTDGKQAGKVAAQVPEAGKTVPRGTKVALRVLRYVAPPGRGGVLSGGGGSGGFRPPGVGGGFRPPGVGGGFRPPGVGSGPPIPGPRQLAVVPDVKGKPQAEAERLLKGKGLNPQVGGVFPTPDRTQAGKVASQVPAAGQTVPRGTKVALRVLRYVAPPGRGGVLSGGGGSGGFRPPGVGGVPPPGGGGVPPPGGGGVPPPGGGRPPIPGPKKLGEIAKVPDVVNMTKTEAINKIEKVGLKAKINIVGGADKEQVDKVKAQNPRAGKMLFKNKTVTLDVWVLGTVVTVSKTVTVGPMTMAPGPPPIKIFDASKIVGMERYAAEKELRDGGFKPYVKKWWPEGRDVAWRGKVTALGFPEAGGRIGLNVYKWLEEGKFVPDVTGIVLERAKRVLKGAGYKLEGTFVYTENESAHCTIQKTNPPKNGSLERGGEVYMYVYTIDLAYHPDPGIRKAAGKVFGGYGMLGKVMGDLVVSAVKGKAPCYLYPM